MDERLLELYNIELRHLRETAAEFGREYPKIAGRLAIDPDGKTICADPYVERLLEGFAFLAARVHLKLDSEFPRFTQGLLETIYPDYLCPLPAMAIVKFDPEEQEPALAQGFAIKRGAQMRSQLAKGDRTPCTFTLAHDLRLLPLVISEARYYHRDVAELNLPKEAGAKAAFRLRLRKTVGNPFAQIAVSPLLVFIRGAGELPGQIYEQIFAHRSSLIVQWTQDRRRQNKVFNKTCIRQFGFEPEQALLPSAPQTFEGYRLLREYFAFPSRFLFFELAGFQEALAKAEGEEIDVILALDQPETGLEGRVDRTNFDLHCAAAINLFEKSLDPVLVSNRVTEFHIVPVRNRPLDYEVFQLTSVIGTASTHEQETVFLPFYRARDTDLSRGAFYTLHRVPRLLTDREQVGGPKSSYTGTDAFLSIVDADMAPALSNVKQLTIRALCTNRHLANQIAKGAGRSDFTLTDLSGPVKAIRIIDGPTPPHPSLVLAGQDVNSPQAASGRFAWRLISHLSLNYLSLVNNSRETGAEALREMLKLYADPADRQALKQIDGLRNVRHRPIIRRVEVPGPISFARGLEIGVEFDESAFEGQGVFVLGAVLERFFAKYVSLNSFTETIVATQQRKEVFRWAAQPGLRPML